MQIRELMSRIVERVGPEDTVAEAAKRMARRNVGILPVMDDDKPIGTITDRDIVVRVVAKLGAPQEVRVRDVMSTKPVTCYQDQDIKDAAQLMERCRIRRLIVLDREQRLVGMLSLGDLPRKDEGYQVVAEIMGAVAARAD